ncbi:MAG TPA: DoxX family protein [Microbacterium sp.]|nr:DoxX family protein [Microbacterium sp.]
MLIALWILNGLLALVFVGAGLMKLARPKQALAESGMAYVEDFSAAQVKLIGLVEVVGAVGLILPLLLNIAPVLTPIAAVGLAVTMLVATTVHVRRKESPLPTVVLAVLAIASAILGFIVVL